MNKSKYPWDLLFVSTSYPADENDWRGVFIADMVRSLASASECSLSLWAPGEKNQPNLKRVSDNKERCWLKRLMAEGGIANIYRRGGLSAITRILQLLYYLKRMYMRELPRADLVHVNWLQNALPLIGTRKPLLVTVLGTDMKMLRLPGMVSVLRRVFRSRPCIIAPNADWMMPELDRRFGDVAKILPIPFGINESWYHLYSNRISVANSRDGKSVYLVVLRITEEKIGNLFQWGEELFSGHDKTLHLLGPMQGQVTIPDWVSYHGPTNPHELQIDWFPRATALISMSLHDEGRPQVMLEAMAAGLPIIASDIKAHVDLLSHEDMGFICRTKEQFTESVQKLDDPGTYSRVSEQAYRWVREELGTWEDCANRYNQAYDDLMEGVC